MLLKGENGAFVEIRLLEYDNPRAKQDGYTINLLRVFLAVGCEDGRQGHIHTLFLTDEVQDLLEWLTSIHQQRGKEKKFDHHLGRIMLRQVDDDTEPLTLGIYFSLPDGKRSQLPENREYPDLWSGDCELALTPAHLEEAIQALTAEAAQFPVRTPRKKSGKPRKK